jgi:hypothetical protein
MFHVTYFISLLWLNRHELISSIFYFYIAIITAFLIIIIISKPCSIMSEVQYKWNYLCVRCIHFASFYYFTIGFWNCSDSIIFFFSFYLVTIFISNHIHWGRLHWSKNFVEFCRINVVTNKECTMSSMYKTLYPI